ncbi:MAG: type II secretion system protein [Erysipelotrichaceae bacterium]
MVKQVFNKGFTMIEMIIVLSIISIMLLLVPKLFIYEIPLSYQMQYLKEQLLSIQMKALLQKQRINIEIQSNGIYVHSRFQPFQGNMICEPTTLSFNQFGNVNHAQSIMCYLHQNQIKLVIQLGSGRMNVQR